MSKFEQHVAPCENSYFRFPLALMRFPESTDQLRLDAIVDYCIVDVGRKVAEKLGSITDQRELAVERLGASRRVSECDLHVLFGARRLKITGARPERVLAVHQKLTKWLSSQAANERRATVNMPSHLLWACLYFLRGEYRSDFLTWDEFRVLSAIGS